ncbi:MAG: hypothetical protein HQL63_03025 [Magnetococcales bacterium]|nr:hypothetical protein [Magnetococcales bacterium]MBF0321864.1 hypothetical protein [Magnetococcales bacterium]
MNRHTTNHGKLSTTKWLTASLLLLAAQSALPPATKAQDLPDDSHRKAQELLKEAVRIAEESAHSKGGVRMEQ